jgi:hypothetical protein
VNADETGNAELPRSAFDGEILGDGENSLEIVKGWVGQSGKA